MSIHCLQTVTRDGIPVDVQTGWDDTLPGFSLVVVPTDDEDRDPTSSCRFSNLNYLPGVPLGKGYVVLHSNLQRLGITLPSTMLSAVLKDTKRNNPNMRILWDADGSVRDIRSWGD